MFFKLNIDYYPNSASAYSAMADYYETRNDRANALKYVTRAFELSGEHAYKDRIKALEKKN